jgi:hypothetical protein
MKSITSPRQRRGPVIANNQVTDAMCELYTDPYHRNSLTKAIEPSVGAKPRVIHTNDSIISMRVHIQVR